MSIAVAQKKSESTAAGAPARVSPATPNFGTVTPMDISLIQRKSSCACGGSCPSCRAKDEFIQPKLKIGAPNDKYEQEADRVADQVMRMPEPIVRRQPVEEEDEESIQTKPNESLQRQPSDEEEEEELQTKALNGIVQRQAEVEEEETLQTKATPGHTPTVGATTHAKIQSLEGGGQPLPSNQRHFFESRMGHDFSGVRIHTDSKAADTAQTIQAKAYTLGNNIVFNTGQYSHDNQEGKKLLAHELTHVVQQKRTIQSSIQRKEKGPRTDAFDKECPDTVVIGSIKPIAEFNKAKFDSGIRTWLGINSFMKVGPKEKYESCITEVLKVEENTCGNKGMLAEYTPCTKKKYCLPVGGNEKYPTDPNMFWDMHRTSRKFNLLEDSGKKTCKVTCLQRYGGGGKEIGRFYVTRTFKAATFKDGKKEAPVTLGSITKVIAKRNK